MIECTPHSNRVQSSHYVWHACTPHLLSLSMVTVVLLCQTGSMPISNLFAYATADDGPYNRRSQLLKYKYTQNIFVHKKTVLKKLINTISLVQKHWRSHVSNLQYFQYVFLLESSTIGC